MATAAGFYSQFTADQIRAQYAKNADGLRTMAAKAARTGRRVNGFTVEHLTERATEYTRLSLASDDEIRAHLSRPIPPYRERAALREATLNVGRSSRRRS